MFAKKINDIKIRSGHIICERFLNMNIIDLESYISKLQYTGVNKVKDVTVENYKFSPFIVSFYHFIYSYLRIPSESEFIENYYKLNSIDYTNDYVNIDNSTFSKSSLDARILRTYPSLIRDYHFVILLSEYKELNVEYSLNDDYYNGLDIKINYNDINYYLSLYINTSRGASFKEQKYKRHNYNDINEIELNVEFNQLKKVGEFYLLTENDIKNVLNLIKFNNDDEVN